MSNIYNYFKKAYPSNKELPEVSTILTFLLAVMLIVIPLKYAFGSIATIIFVVASLSLSKLKLSFNKVFLLPILFYCLMAASLFWTKDTALTTKGLQKELPFLIIPLVFLFVPALKKINKKEIIKWYSYSMVAYALFYLLKAAFRFIQSGDKKVFFYHELVTEDVNAIYISVFASLAVLYFFALPVKKVFDRAAIFLLIGLVFLLSSKSIITIDFILIICYYSFFSNIPKGVKMVTISAIVLFLGCSLVFVKEVKERFMLEYETAFVDNTLNTKISDETGKVYNVSLRQAWQNERFQPNHFFPGTALRVYQVRIFKEMMQEENTFVTGYGLEASQEKIREKAVSNNLYTGYGEFNFHNQYIQTFSELGVFGFLILVLMLLANLKNGWKHKDFLHIAFAITMIILFLTESFFCRQRGVMFFIILYCVFNSGALLEEKKEV